MKRFLQIAGSLSIVVIVGSAVGCNSPISLRTPTPPQISATQQITTDTTTATPTLTSTPSATRPVVKPPTWQGITPGLTMREEVIGLLGAPSITQSFQRLESLNYYPKGLDSFQLAHDRYRIILRDEVVQLIIIDQQNEALLSTLKREIGEPERVKEYSDVPYGDVYIFAERGFAAEAVDDRLWTLEYFVPMTTQEYLSTWGQYHPQDVPFPQSFPGDPITAGISPGVSTRQDILRLYGDPGFVGTWDRWGDLSGGTSTQEKPTVYMYRIPVTAGWKYVGNAFVSFILDTQAIVQFVHIWGNSGMNATLKDALASYGTPQWTFEYPKPSHPSPFQDLVTCYFFPDKGVGVRAVAHFESSPDDIIQAEWHFPPMTWDAYWSSWGVNPCSGFRFGEIEGNLSEWKGFPKP